MNGNSNRTCAALAVVVAGTTAVPALGVYVLSSVNVGRCIGCVFVKVVSHLQGKREKNRMQSFDLLRAISTRELSPWGIYITRTRIRHQCGRGVRRGRRQIAVFQKRAHCVRVHFRIIRDFRQQLLARVLFVSIDVVVHPVKKIPLNFVDPSKASWANRTTKHIPVGFMARVGVDEQTPLAVRHAVFGL